MDLLSLLTQPITRLEENIIFALWLKFIDHKHYQTIYLLFHFIFKTSFFYQIIYNPSLIHNVNGMTIYEICETIANNWRMCIG